MHRWIVWGGLYAALAIGLTWPLAAHLTDHFPKGNVPTSVPALAGTWALWWVSDRLPHAFVGLWDAPIFFPVHGTFAFSETTLPLGVLAAPMFWLGLPPALIYNLVVLGCLVGNGLAARWLARLLGCGPLAAGLAGVLLVASPTLLRNLTVLPMVPVFGILLFCGAMLRLAEEPGPRTGAAAGGAWALTWLLSLQYGLFLTLVAPLLALGIRSRKGLATGALVAAVLLGPVLVPQRAHLQAHGFERSEARATAGAADLGKNWLNPPREGRLPLPGLPRRQGAGQFPGVAVVALVLGGLALNRHDRRVWALAAVAGASVALSTLPHWHLGGFEPYPWLRDTVPGLDRIRETRRAGAVAIALIPVLAALGLDALGRRTHDVVSAGVVALALLNHWPDPHRLQRGPDVARFAPLAAALRAHVPDEGAVAFLQPSAGSETPEADLMVLQAGHGRRMVNGYSSYYPADFLALRRKMGSAPSRRSFTALRAAGVTHVVAPEDWEPWPALERVWGPAPTGDTLYRLR